MCRGQGPKNVTKSRSPFPSDFHSPLGKTTRGRGGGGSYLLTSHTNARMEVDQSKGRKIWEIDCDEKLTFAKYLRSHCTFGELIIISF